MQFIRWEMEPKIGMSVSTLKVEREQFGSFWLKISFMDSHKGSTKKPIHSQSDDYPLARRPVIGWETCESTIVGMDCPISLVMFL